MFSLINPINTTTAFLLFPFLSCSMRLFLFFLFEEERPCKTMFLQSTHLAESDTKNRGDITSGFSLMKMYKLVISNLFLNINHPLVQYLGWDQKSKTITAWFCSREISGVVLPQDSSHVKLLLWILHIIIY